MARAALRDDLFSLHAELTADVLRYGGIDAWMEANRAAVERAQEILGEIRSGGTFDLTTLPVALREVRNLIQVQEPRPRGVKLLHSVEANAPGSGPSWSSIRVTHLTQMKPRCPGATSRTGAPWPWLSGSSPTWVASSRSRASARSKLQR